MKDANAGSSDSKGWYDRFVSTAGKSKGKGKNKGKNRDFGNAQDDSQTYKYDSSSSGWQSYKLNNSKGKGKKGTQYTPDPRRNYYQKHDDQNDPGSGGGGSSSSSTWNSSSWNSNVFNTNPPWQSGNTYGDKGNTQKGNRGGKSWNTPISIGIFTIQVVLCSLCNVFSGLGHCQECRTSRLFNCPFGCDVPFGTGGCVLCGLHGKFLNSKLQGTGWHLNVVPHEFAHAYFRS
jgi:hypothetical protein